MSPRAMVVANLDDLREAIGHFGGLVGHKESYTAMEVATSHVADRLETAGVVPVAQLAAGPVYFAAEVDAAAERLRARRQRRVERAAASNGGE